MASVTRSVSGPRVASGVGELVGPVGDSRGLGLPTLAHGVLANAMPLGCSVLVRSPNWDVSRWSIKLWIAVVLRPVAGQSGLCGG